MHLPQISQLQEPSIRGFSRVLPRALIIGLFVAILSMQSIDGGLLLCLVVFCALLALGVQSQYLQKIDSIKNENERLLAEREELVAQNELLNETVEDLDRFTYSASHDLRAPLRAISTLAGFIRDDLGHDLPAPVSYNIDRMQARLETMHALVDGLRKSARLGRRDNLDPINLDTLVSETLALLDPIGEVVLEKRFLVSELRAPASVITQIVRNLIDNSIKYRGPKPLVIHASSFLARNYVVIVLRDNGLGLSKAERESINLQFSGGAPADTSGSGLGLPLAGALTRRHGGNLVLAGRPDESGTRAMIYWPSQSISR